MNGSNNGGARDVGSGSATARRRARWRMGCAGVVTLLVLAGVGAGLWASHRGRNPAGPTGGRVPTDIVLYDLQGRAWTLGVVPRALPAGPQARASESPGSASGAPSASEGATAGTPPEAEPLGGQPLVLRFSSVTCTYCAPDQATLLARQRELGKRARIVPIDVGDPPNVARGELTKRGHLEPSLLDPDGRLAGALGIRGLPSYVFVRADGIVVANSWQANRDGTMSDADWQEDVQLLLQGR